MSFRLADSSDSALPNRNPSSRFHLSIIGRGDADVNHKLSVLGDRQKGGEQVGSNKVLWVSGKKMHNYSLYMKNTVISTSRWARCLISSNKKAHSGCL